MGKDTSFLRAKEKIKERSLFIAWGDGGGKNFGGNYLIFRGTKGGISRNLEPKRGGHIKIWKGSEGGPLKFTWKMKTWKGIAKVIKSY